jgi:hypothetical protein
MLLIGICGTLVAQSPDAPEVLAPAIDGYLNGVHTTTHPLAQHGTTFVTEGAQYKVNPRFLVAITGGETTFGVHVCGQNNAFNWFWNGSCPASPFDSWDSGIHTVAHYMQKSYVLHGYTTIPTIATKYCTSGCTNWVPLISQFYTNLGGDPSAAVIWNGAAPAQTPTSTTTPDQAPVVAASPVATAPTITAQLGSITRNGFFLSSNQTVSLQVMANAQNLGSLKPVAVSLVLTGTNGSQVVGTLAALPASPGGAQYSTTVTLPENTLDGATLSVQMTLSAAASKKVSMTLYSPPLAVPSSSHTTLFLVLGGLLALLLVGVIVAVMLTHKNKTTAAGPSTPPVVSK